MEENLKATIYFIVSTLFFGICIGLSLYDDFPNYYVLNSIITGGISMILYTIGLFNLKDK